MTGVMAHTKKNPSGLATGKKRGEKRTKCRVSAQQQFQHTKKIFLLFCLVWDIYQQVGKKNDTYLSMCCTFLSAGDYSRRRLGQVVFTRHDTQLSDVGNDGGQKFASE